MQLLHLILLLLFTAVAKPNNVEAAEDIDILHAKRHLHVLTQEDPSADAANDGNPNTFGHSTIEERGVFSSAMSKIKGVLGKTKNIGLGEKLARVRKDPDVAAAVGNSPVIKKLEKAVVNDPNFFTKLKNKLKSNPESIEKLAKNPDVQRAGAALDKSKAKITSNDINQLRTAVAGNPSKTKMLKDGLLLAHYLFILSPFIVLAGLIIYLIGWAISLGITNL